MSVFVRHCRVLLRRVSLAAIASLLAASISLVRAQEVRPAAAPPPGPIQVTIEGKAIPVREFARTPYVAWEDFAGAIGLEHYYSEATGSYSLVNGQAGKETAIEMTPGSRDVSVNGEMRKLPAVPLVKDGILWLPVKPFAELAGKPVKSLKFSRVPAGKAPPESQAVVRAVPDQTTVKPSAAPAKAKAAASPKLPPLPKPTAREREIFAGTRVALFGRLPAGTKGDDPRAPRSCAILRDLLETSGFQVHEVQPAASWPAPVAVNALRPHLVVFLECSDGQDRAFVYYPVARPAASAEEAEGLFGPNAAEAALSKELAAAVGEKLQRLTGVPGQPQADANLMPISRVVAASLLIGYPAKAGPSGQAGELALARSLHDGIVTALGEKGAPAVASAPVPAPAAEPAPPPPPPPSPSPPAAPATPPATDDGGWEMPGVDTPAEDEPPASQPEQPPATSSIDVPGEEEGTYSPLPSDSEPPKP